MNVYKVRYFDKEEREIRIVYTNSPLDTARTRRRMAKAFAPLEILSIRRLSDKQSKEINSMFY